MLRGRPRPLTGAGPVRRLNPPDADRSGEPPGGHMRASTTMEWVGLAVALVVAGAGVPAAQSMAAAPAAAVDQTFARFTSETPGCAVGVSVDGATVLARGYGMADLEHDVAIGPETIFEAGSVSKQFT